MVKFMLKAAALLALFSGASALKKNRMANGLNVVSGEADELARFKNKLDKKLEQIERSNVPTPRDLHDAADKISGKYASLKLMIQQQMVKDVIKAIHPLTLDGLPWNSSMGTPPLRGSYDSVTLSSDLEQLGLKKSTPDGKEILPHSHYCKYRTPSEVNGDKYSCCIGENTECYTTAGCFCDESCYTKYGDCCTDHFLTCYEHLKLCLIRVDTTGSNDVQEIANNGKIHKGQQDQYMQNQIADEEDLIMGRSAQLPGDEGPGPKATHVEPNACCLQSPFNTNEQNDKGQTKSCCKGVLTFDTCVDEDQEF